MTGEPTTKTKTAIDDALETGKSRSLWRNFFINVSIIIILTGLGIVTGISLSSQKVIEESIDRRARAHFKDIVLTRRWNSNYGGVYVEKKPGIESNPYLVNPDITASDGKVYTKKNPALMTREISELALKEGEYQYHITSLKLRNPNNAPDDWERQALQSFETGNKESMTNEPRADRVYYRYMAPLIVEKGCLQCHADQGYHEGDVRGGISVSFDVTEVQQALQTDRIVTIALFVLTLATLLGVIYLFVTRLYRRLSAAQERIKELAITDALTGLFNRRHFFTLVNQEIARALRYQHSLSCIMIDLDNFKTINDRYGHLAGDRVLCEIAAILKDNCRESDIVARYGGEEFIILLPQTSIEGAHQTAEKIRHFLASSPVATSDSTAAPVTASFGVAVLNPQAPDPGEDLLHRTDQALYCAKDGGRNRVVLAGIS